MAKQAAKRATRKPTKPDFSSIPTFFPVGNTVSDDRGEIRNILRSPLPIESAVLITSKAGTRRADHYHRATGWHFCYVTKGRIRYTERPVGSTDRPEVRQFIIGDIFFTPPGVEHGMFFEQDTEFWCFSGNERSHEAYEDDLVRLPSPLVG